MTNEEKMASRIHQKRTELGMTMEELGKKVGVQRSAVNKWEHGMVSNMKRATISKLSDALNVSPSWLMGWDDIEWDQSTQEIEDHGYYEDDDAKAYADFLFKNPEYKVLFDASKKVKAEDLHKAVTALGLFAKDDDVDG